VVQQDEKRVCEILTHSHGAIDELNSKGQSPMHLCGVGIEILLENGGQKLVNQFDRRGLLPVTYAIYNKIVLKQLSGYWTLGVSYLLLTSTEDRRRLAASKLKPEVN